MLPVSGEAATVGKLQDGASGGEPARPRGRRRASSLRLDLDALADDVHSLVRSNSNLSDRHRHQFGVATTWTVDLLAVIVRTSSYSSIR
ncbi:Os09g0406900 [Oryza sativa Japonica Group]|uniref:Os09g0406900 protein n=1 Tax=Oryza sativa subsp. japonica TaxID=39947 RepID=Q69MY2_ORYSJ|nr:unknown protein [Oryza sativa Japonica Group]BAF25047.1 Os09g0406900 [Oryza sativa Japonica Group]|eukprot:NP_001063133.1 Os09g0406900 [Oryza sativa Japonica Group]